MSKYTFEQYRQIFDGVIRKYEGQDFFVKLIETLGKPAFPSAPRDVAAIGIRREGKEKEFRENTADDTISLVRIDSDGLQQVYEYAGTTESGLFKEVINPEGDFKMSPGFYFFKHGIHHGKNPCLVQAGAVLGERAKKGKAYDETDSKTWQITDGSLHIHAGIMNKENVGNWSAGCQVIAGGFSGKEWTEFYKNCQMATNLPIPYLLVNETDIPELLGV
ncbi:MAG TPA: hypothetical protein VGV87_23360 [Blastocatellia bacterium]|jgi:hypothetical protein|nr:hypothetical protein [Blastocatellia bacterium]